MKRIIIFACLVFGFYYNGLSQNTLFGNGGYNIQSYKFYWNNGSDSLARIAPWGIKFFKSIYANKDSIPLIGSITNEHILVVDTSTGRLKRISASSLTGSGSGMKTGINTYTSNTTASSGDIPVYIFLDGTSSTVDYDIDPTAFSGETLVIKCINATNTVKITLDSGTIDGLSELQLLLNQTVWVYSNGTNLFIVNQ